MCLKEIFCILNVDFLLLLLFETYYILSYPRHRRRYHSHFFEMLWTAEHWVFLSIC